MPLTATGTHYTLSGRPDAPAVVLIHGLGLNADIWRWLMPELERDFRVLSYDILGHGASAPPPPSPTLRTLSDQLSDLLTVCGIERAACVGFSLGGMIARRFAQDHPARVSALAILHSPHQRTPEAQAAILARVEQARREGPKATVEAALVRWFTDDYRARSPEMMDLVRSWVLANDPAIYPSIYRILAEGVDEIVAPTPPITCPALVITGEEDYGNGPEMTRAIAAEIGGATALVLPGLRHMALAEAPQAVNQPLVAFLREHLCGAAV
ncbi:MAG: alpha/beta fold hydrolase [Rhodobacteraceae bacterium]|nr:alpha/beta fold hydrolase [Paracoccaceae bacterium]